MVNNKGSKSVIILHNDLILLPSGSVRLFNYKIDADGLSSHNAGRAINPTLLKLMLHRLKSAYSFRGMLKVMLRNVKLLKRLMTSIQVIVRVTLH